MPENLKCIGVTVELQTAYKNKTKLIFEYVLDLICKVSK